MMKILLTGHKGFIGEELMPVLCRRKGALIDMFDSPKNFFADWAAFAPLTIPDVIIHAGAISDSTHESPNIFEQNTEATRALAKYAAHHNARLIFLSTHIAYEPTNLYGWSKKYAEGAITEQMDNYCILRLPNIYGDEDHPKDNPSVITKLQRGTLDFIVEGYTRRFLHVGHVVLLINGLLDNWTPGTFNVEGAERTIHQLIAQFGTQKELQIKTPEASGIPAKIEIDESLPMLSAASVQHPRKQACDYSGEDH